MVGATLGNHGVLMGFAISQAEKMARAHQKAGQAGQQVRR